jgi:hypothetical protein
MQMQQSLPDPLKTPHGRPYVPFAYNLILGNVILIALCKPAIQIRPSWQDVSENLLLLGGQGSRELDVDPDYEISALSLDLAVRHA